MKYSKNVFFDGYISINTVIRETGFPLSVENGFQVFMKDGALVLKPFISHWQAEKLARDFILENSPTGYYDIEINDRQRVVACAIGGHVGVAYCSKEDSFNPTIGKALALSRALRRPLPKRLQIYLGID